MKTSKRFITAFPEYYLMIVVLLAGYTPPFTINPISVGAILILILQIRFKLKMTGIILATLFLLVNLYMLLALISEFSEFAAFNAEAMSLLFTGLVLFVLNGLASTIMIIKYTRQEDNAHHVANDN